MMSMQSFAQDKKKTKDETFFSKEIESTGYGAITTQYSEFNGRGAIFMGLYGGWMINHRLMIGLGGGGLMNRPDGFNKVGEHDGSNEIQMGYGGLMVEYTFASTKKIHLTTSALIGGGGVSNGHYSPVSNTQATQWRIIDDSGFYIFQPTLNIEMNMTNWFRIAAGGGYRYVTGAEIAGLTNGQMSAPTASLSLKFGLF